MIEKRTIMLAKQALKLKEEIEELKEIRKGKKNKIENGKILSQIKKKEQELHTYKEWFRNEKLLDFLEEATGIKVNEQYFIKKAQLEYQNNEYKRKKGLYL